MKIIRVEFTIANLLAVLALAYSTAAPLAQSAAAGSKEKAATPAVLVELFTSEGCNTCPPADKLLSELDANQPIAGEQVITLSEHVDYWNHLGWKDPFSSAQFTGRQTDYSKVLHFEDIYTPQMIVDGRREFIGSKRTAAFAAIAEAAQSPKASVTLGVKEMGASAIKLIVQLENVPEVARGDTAEVMMAIAESGITSRVSRGENSGRELAHSSVTRKLIKIGKVEGASFTSEASLNLDRAWKRQQLKAVVFLQERAGRRVLGAAQIKLADQS